MKIYIAIVSNRDHKARFVGSLYALTQNLIHHGKSYGIEAHMIAIGEGHSCLSRGRQDALDTALKNGSTHLLFIDDDMVFPPNILQMLTQRKLPVVAANYVLKDQESLRFVARDANGKRISSKGKTGVEEVCRTGTGMFLVECNAVRHIPGPHFEVVWNAEKKDYISEDSYFCDKLRAHGVTIHIDHDASQNIGHVGDFVYSMRSGG